MNTDNIKNFDDVPNFYDIKIKSSIMPELLCAICHRVMQNASLLACGCRFCRRCIEVVLSLESKCPSCGAMSGTVLSPDQAINEDIGKLWVKCPRCRQSMKMKSVKQHLNICNKECIRKLVGEIRALVNTWQETHTWNIRNFPTISKESKRYSTASFYSNPFYTRDGYHMKWIIYPYGKGIYRGSHISMFYVIMKGDHDDRLQWPFNMELCFWIQNPKDQDDIYEKRIPANAEARCNAKPLGEGVENGVVNFLPIDEVDRFLNDDSLSIKCSMKRS